MNKAIWIRLVVFALLAILIAVAVIYAPSPFESPISPISPISPLPTLPIEIQPKPAKLESLDDVLLVCSGIQPSAAPINPKLCQGQKTPFIMGDILINCYGGCLSGRQLVHGCNTSSGLTFVTVCQELAVYYMPVILK